MGFCWGLSFYLFVMVFLSFFFISYLQLFCVTSFFRSKSGMSDARTKAREVTAMLWLGHRVSHQCAASVVPLCLCMFFHNIQDFWTPAEERERQVYSIFFIKRFAIAVPLILYLKGAWYKALKQFRTSTILSPSCFVLHLLFLICSLLDKLSPYL